MPIKPENRDKYPPNWREISRKVRERAGDICECKGECGKHHGHCGVANRSPLPSGWRVILTVAHVDHDPTNCIDENLRAWCQRCHLAYDAAEHRKNSEATRMRKKQAQRQGL